MNEQNENPELSQHKYEQKLYELTKERFEKESRWANLTTDDWERITDEENEKLQARLREEIETEKAINEEEAEIPLIPILHLPTKAESQMNESDSIFKSGKDDIRSTELKDSEPSEPLRLSEFNFQQVPNVLVNHVRDKKIKPIDVVVWIAFANHQRKKEYSWPSNSTIAVIVGRDIRSVNRSIIRLQKAGHLNRVGRTHYGTKKTYLNTRVGADCFVVQPTKQMPEDLISTDQHNRSTSETEAINSNESASAASIPLPVPRESDDEFLNEIRTRIAQRKAEGEHNVKKPSVENKLSDTDAKNVNKSSSNNPDAADPDSLANQKQLISSNRESVPDHHKEIWSNDEFLSDPDYIPF